MKLDQETSIEFREPHSPVWTAAIPGHVARFAKLTVIVVALMYAAGRLGYFHWFADLFANFVPHMSAILFGCLVVLVFARCSGWAIAAGVLLATGLVTLAPYLIGNGLRADITGGSKLRILQFNVSRQNQDWRDFANWLRPRVDQFDIIVLLENTPSWTGVVRWLSKEFPAQLEVSRTDSYGIAVFSRLPDSQLRLGYLGRENLPAVELNAHLDGRPLTVIATHTSAPMGRITSDGRNAQLRELAEWVAAAPRGHKVLLGDLNLTPFSPWFRDLLEATGLSDAQNGRGLLPTWAPRSFPTTLGLSIDHTLISDTFSVTYRDCEQRLGSDHCPVITELRTNSLAQT